MSSGVPVHKQARAGIGRIVMSSRDQQEMLRLVRYVTPDPTADPEEFCQQARRAAAQLPPSIAEPLRDFHRRGVPGGIIVIVGFPVRGVPPTPAADGDPLAGIRIATGLVDLAEHFDDYRFGRRPC